MKGMVMKWLNIFQLLILVISPIAWSDPQISKDWHWDLSDSGDYAYAATTNADGRILGQYCYYEDKTCVYLVSLGILCDSGSEYPSLINSNTGVKEVDLICGHLYQGENVFFVKPFDEIDDLVKEASYMGFAVAMKEGEFKVVRFSLVGSTYAIEKMRAAASIVINAMEQEQTPSKQRLRSEEYL